AQLVRLHHRILEILLQALDALLVLRDDLVARLQELMGLRERALLLLELLADFLRLGLRDPDLGAERADAVVARVALGGGQLATHPAAHLGHQPAGDESARQPVLREFDWHCPSPAEPSATP